MAIVIRKFGHRAQNPDVWILGIGSMAMLGLLVGWLG